MQQAWIWAAAGGLVLAAFFILRKPLAFIWRLVIRSGIGLCFLWLFNQIGVLFGIRLGINLISGLVLGLLGVPGFGLLLMLRWMLQ